MKRLEEIGVVHGRRKRSIVKMVQGMEVVMRVIEGVDGGLLRVEKTLRESVKAADSYKVTWLCKRILCQENLGWKNEDQRLRP